MSCRGPQALTDRWEKKEDIRGKVRHGKPRQVGIAEDVTVSELRLTEKPPASARGVRHGVIRHPGYLGLLANSLGWGLAFPSGAGVLLLVVLLPPLIARIRAEEALLRAHFGDEYEAYRGRTSCLIPGV